MLRWLCVILALGAAIPTLLARAEEGKDETKPGEIRLPLKGFKFKVPEDKTELFAFDEDGERLCFYTDGTAEAKFNIESDGDYDLLLSLSGDSAMNTRPKFKLAIDDKEVGKEMSLKSDDIKEYKLTIPLKHGKHVLSVTFTNDMYKDGEYDSNLYLHGAKFMPHKSESSAKQR